MFQHVLNFSLQVFSGQCVFQSLSGFSFEMTVGVTVEITVATIVEMTVGIMFGMQVFHGSPCSKPHPIFLLQAF